MQPRCLLCTIYKNPGFPVALEPRFKVVERILKIRFEGARIRHRVWFPGARGLLDGEGMNRKSARQLCRTPRKLSEDVQKSGEGQGSKKLFLRECARTLP